MDALTRLKLDEGLRLRVYKDTKGNPSIGYGINLDAGIYPDEAVWLLKNRVSILISELNSKLAFYAKLSDVRQAVFLNIRYNVGDEFYEWHDTINHAAASEWSACAEAILASLAARELPTRYQRLAKMIETGEWQA